MAFQMGGEDNSGMSEMNLIPLIDIMLVLMIIFLVTATVLKPSVPLTLPQTSASIQSSQDRQIIQVSIDQNNSLFIDQEAVSLDQLNDRLTEAKNQFTPDTVPSINIRADKQANYDAIANVLATASNAGLTDIAFVSD